MFVDETPRAREVILNRISRLNWRYAAGEILLIFVGISLAIAFDEWRQHQANVALERELLVEILDDLAETQTDLSDDMDRNQSEMRASVRFIKWLEDGNTYDGFRRDVRSHLGGGGLFPKVSGYRALQDAGLVIIRDPKLRTKITNFYQLRLSRVSRFEENLLSDKDSLRSILIEYLKLASEIPDASVSPSELWQARQIDIELHNIQAMFADTRLGVRLAYTLGSSLGVDRMYTAAMADLESLASDIESYLGRI